VLVPKAAKTMAGFWGDAAFRVQGVLTNARISTKDSHPNLFCFTMPSSFMKFLQKKILKSQRLKDCTQLLYP
jgi:hypothetical protein